MISSLYRIRRLDNLLGARKELENQHIYFAAPSELNDPMEGLQDLHWTGDKIVWANLLKHYLMCLERAFMIWHLPKQTLELSWKNIPVSHIGDPSLSPQHRKILNEIAGAFLAEPAIATLIENLCRRRAPVRRMELTAYLWHIHTFAILTIHQCYKRNGLVAGGPDAEAIENARRPLFDVGSLPLKMEDAANTHPQCDDATEMFFAAQMMMTRQFNIIRLYNNIEQVEQHEKNFVLVDFVQEYVAQLERLVYPDWYTACFMRNAKNASIWASYGESHTGVCLKFKVSNNDGRPCLKIRRPVGWNAGGEIYGDVDQEFLPIDYSRKHVTTDFFCSLACLPVPTLSRFWYSDEQGNRSGCGDTMMNADNARRESYWARFYESITVKTRDWSYEEEYRLVLRGEMLDFRARESRQLRYDFADLEGIIFGMRTPEKSKLEIMRIIEEKCKASLRTDFRFFQALFSPKTQSIEHAELSLLRFKQ